jgi:hypothetical protein
MGQGAWSVGQTTILTLALCLLKGIPLHIQELRYMIQGFLSA